MQTSTSGPCSQPAAVLQASTICAICRPSAATLRRPHKQDSPESQSEAISCHTWPLEPRRRAALAQGMASREAMPERDDLCGSTPELVVS